MNIFDDFEYLNFDEFIAEDVESSATGFSIFNKFETLNLLNFDETIWQQYPQNDTALICDNATHSLSSDSILIAFPKEETFYPPQFWIF